MSDAPEQPRTSCNGIIVWAELLLGRGKLGAGQRQHWREITIQKKQHLQRRVMAAGLSSGFGTKSKPGQCLHHGRRKAIGSTSIPNEAPSECAILWTRHFQAQTHSHSSWNNTQGVMRSSDEQTLIREARPNRQKVCLPSGREGEKKLPWSTRHTRLHGSSTGRGSLK